MVSVSNYVEKLRQGEGEERQLVGKAGRGASHGAEMTNVMLNVVNVYVACNMSVKVILWEKLSNIKSAHQDLAWCFYDDFNDVRSAKEMRGVKKWENNQGK